MTRFARSCVLVAIGLAIFFFARLALVLCYPESFAGLSWGHVGLAFLNGLRFDLNVLLAAFAGPLLLMNLPFRWCQGLWFRIWSWVSFASLIPMILILVGDLVYYPYVQRHIADELIQLQNDFDFVWAEALGDFLPALLGCLAFLVLVGLLWRLALRGDPRSGRPILGLAVLVAGCVLGIRGSLDSKPIGLIDAFRSGNTAFGNLCLNGVFSSFHGSLDSYTGDHRFLDDKEVLAELGLPDTRYPLLRRLPGKQLTGLNVMILLLESWDVHYLDSYDAKGLGLSPNFDALAREGVKFENMYAASQRSNESIQAILSGIPPIFGLPELGRGLEMSNVTELGSVAGRHGYETVFVQSSKRHSYRLDSVARSLGFQHAYGREDIPTRLDYPTKEKPKWGWDYETLMFALDKVTEFEAPFIGFIFTGSTHSPYPDPGARFHKRPHESHGLGGYCNTLYYSDWALAEFMNAARSRPWFEKTVFLICADHVWRCIASTDIRDDFRIPFLLYAPALLKPRIRHRVCSQLDCLQTIFDLLGFDDPCSTMGQNLLGENEGFAMVKKGNIMGLVSRRGAVSHSLRQRLEIATSEDPPPPDAYFDSLERRLLATVQLSSQLIHANRWAPAAN